MLFENKAGVLKNKSGVLIITPGLLYDLLKRLELKTLLLEPADGGW